MDAKLDEKIGRLIEENAVEFFMSLGKLHDDKICEQHEITYIFTPKWESRIFKANFSEEDAPKILNSINSQAKKLNISPLWYISPFTRPINLKKILEKYNFYYVENWIAMAIDLDDVTLNFSIPENFEITTVTNISQLKEWINVLVRSFQIPERKIELYKDYFTKIGTENYNFQLYLGSYNKKHVASIILFEGTDAAGIYYVSTLQETRRKGIASAMTKTILYEAKNRGYKICVLHASQEGYPLYKKIGFKKYYTTNIFKQNRNIKNRKDIYL